jgi:hypothetical protein
MLELVKQPSFPRGEATARQRLRRVARHRKPPDDAAVRLSEATKYYERHVLSWYALGRVHEARSARAAILRCRRALPAERTKPGAADPPLGRLAELRPDVQHPDQPYLDLISAVAREHWLGR